MHTVTAFYVTTGFVVVGVAAYLIRRGRAMDEARSMLNVTLWMLTLLVPLQILFGDMHGLNTREHQPAKLAAIEARWETAAHVPLTLFAIPNEAQERNDYAIDVPGLGSWILTHSADGTVQGLKDWPPDQRPPVAIPFFAFRILGGIGLMLAVVLTSLWLRWRRGLLEAPRFRLPMAGFLNPGGARRLVHHRGGPATMDGLRPVAHHRIPSPRRCRDRH